ncbi:hypothetical protein, partial [Corynebacterium striatum]|uniref:hypothetical protein n=1 Tax=Corynebacterium striatum TaxID=43770 RepID=UPI003F7F09B6
PAKPDFASGLSPVNPRRWYQLTGNRQYHGAVTAVPTTRAQHKLRYGLFYYDPTDTRAMVPLPSGSSQFNFGQKTAWFILAGLLVPPVLIIILLNVAT